MSPSYKVTPSAMKKLDLKRGNLSGGGHFSSILITISIHLIIWLDIINVGFIYKHDLLKKKKISK
jgi:hypothetical protein